MKEHYSFMIEISESYKVHIVILTWNNDKILKRCLESIENVDHKNFTIYHFPFEYVVHDKNKK